LTVDAEVPEEFLSDSDLLIQASARPSEAVPAKIAGDILLVDDDDDVRQTLRACELIGTSGPEG
jgi:hypothetical protein